MKTYRSSSARDAIPESPAKKTYMHLQAMAWLLDSSIRLPGGFRIGVEALLGLVPFIGDAVGVVLSGYIVSQAARVGVPHSVLLRMMLNVALEGLVGLVPLLGDVFDAVWKANLRNVQLLGQHLDNPVRTARTSRWLLAAFLLLFVVLVALMAALSMLLLRWAWQAVGGLLG